MKAKALLASLVLATLILSAAAAVVTGEPILRAGGGTGTPTTPQKSTVAATKGNMLVCYRDHVSAVVYALDADGDGDGDGAVKTVQIDVGRIKVNKGESVVVEATVSSLFLSQAVEVVDYYAGRDLHLSMYVQLFKGCTSATACVGADVIQPKPTAMLPLRVQSVLRAENLENANEYSEFVLDAGTNTGRFFFPELLEGDDYFLVVKFVLGARFFQNYGEMEAVSVGLGPHLITAERVRAQGSICVSDDYVKPEDDVAPQLDQLLFRPPTPTAAPTTYY